jgi:tRNA threonylcarbamoyladenosine biosynthesis protein TsaB
MVGEERVSAPARVVPPFAGQWHGAGSGWQSYRDELDKACRLETACTHPDQSPHAADVAALAAVEWQQGRVVAPEQALPVYLRDKVAEKPQAKA